ncbi:MAG TPA: hypothetical protein VFX20_21060 [Steroidobacteraceae bacterium]|nr:hypothetical protein [Steroidobacteraceae bacterium]
MPASKSTRATQAPSDPSILHSAIRAAVDRQGVEVAAEIVPDLDAIHTAIPDERAALLLIADSLTGLRDLGYDHMLTESEAERISAIWTQLHLYRVRLEALSLITDDAGSNYELVPNERERARLRLIAGEARSAAAGNSAGGSRPVRETAQRAAPADIPEAIGRQLMEQQERVYEVQELLEKLADQDREPLAAVLSMAAKALRGVNVNMSDRSQPPGPHAAEGFAADKIPAWLRSSPRALESPLSGRCNDLETRLETPTGIAVVTDFVPYARRGILRGEV